MVFSERQKLAEEIIFLSEKRGITHNVLQLGEEADFEALNCLPALHLIRSTKLHLSTEPAFLLNACYTQCNFDSLLNKWCVKHSAIF
jgi:hypothetical protein